MNKRKKKNAGESLRFTSGLGFTLIELLVVITILAVLTGVALLDYGLSVKKARIQVAAEELAALFGDATVRSQTQFSEIDSEGDGTETIVVCYGITIEEGQPPVLFKTLRDKDTETCLMSDPDAWESVKTLSWEDLVFVTTIHWIASSSPSETHDGDADWITFLFSPPKGDISVYLNPDAPTKEEGVTEVQVHLAYQNSSEPILNKIVKINPVTSSFMILAGAEAESF